MTRLLSALRREEGSALVTAIVLTAVMISMGLAVHALADTQSTQSAQERVRESAFGAAEAALNAQVFQLSKTFPTVSGTYGATCGPASAAAGYCPDGGDLSGYSNGDYSTKCKGTAVTTWTTKVRDNKVPISTQPQQYYDQAQVENLARYDQNGDGALWVRAEGRAGCRTRIIVTLVKQTDREIRFPRNVITANAFSTTNRGKKVIVDTKGAAVSLRCSGYADVNSCAVYERGKGQLAPDTLTAPDPGTSPAVPPEDFEAIKAKAKSLGTYYGPGQCPTTLTGDVVYVESLATCSSVPRAANSAAKPGFLIVNSGTFDIGGNDVFYGTLYMRNATNITGQVVKVQGTAAIVGAVAVDGPGSVYAGSSKANIVFDPNAFGAVKGLGSAAAVPNSWQELPINR